jgi:hypothetical protein
MATRRRNTATGKTRAIAALNKTHDFVQREVDGWKAQLTDIKEVGTEMLKNGVNFEEAVTEVTALAVNFYDLTYGWLLRARDAYTSNGTARSARKTAKKRAKKRAKRRTR